MWWLTVPHTELKQAPHRKSSMRGSCLLSITLFYSTTHPEPPWNLWSEHGLPLNEGGGCSTLWASCGHHCRCLSRGIFVEGWLVFSAPTLFHWYKNCAAQWDLISGSPTLFSYALYSRAADSCCSWPSRKPTRIKGLRRQCCEVQCACVQVCRGYLWALQWLRGRVVESCPAIFC